MCWGKLSLLYICIYRIPVVRNFRMVHFLHISDVHSVQKFEPTKISARCACIQSALALYRYLKPLRSSRCPCKYGSCISPSWRRKMHAPWIEKFELAQSVPGGMAWRTWKIRTSKFYFDGKFGVMRAYAPMKISRYMVYTLYLYAI